MALFLNQMAQWKIEQSGVNWPRNTQVKTSVIVLSTMSQSTLLPAKLALKAGCDLVPLQVERLQDAHFRVTFHPPIRPGNDQLDETAQAIDMIQQVHNQFESWIRKSPQDWFCSKRLWPRVTKDKTEEAGSDADIDSYAA